jgi:hypothetical protein
MPEILNGKKHTDELKFVTLTNATLHKWIMKISDDLHKQ